MYVAPIPSVRASSGQALPGRRRAAATVEFALLAPLLGTLLVGIFEVGRGIMVKEVLSNAARKACRTGVLPARSNSHITADVNSVLTDNGINTAQATVTIKVNDASADASTAAPGAKVSVQVSIPFTAASWTGAFFLGNLTIASETVVMKKQG